jgi:hypothetical protein
MCRRSLHRRAGHRARRAGSRARDGGRCPGPGVRGRLPGGGDRRRRSGAAVRAPRAPARPLVERTDVSPERKDLRPREVQPRPGHVTSPRGIPSPSEARRRVSPTTPATGYRSRGPDRRRYTTAATRRAWQALRPMWDAPHMLTERLVASRSSQDRWPSLFPGGVRTRSRNQVMRPTDRRAAGTTRPGVWRMRSMPLWAWGGWRAGRHRGHHSRERAERPAAVGGPRYPRQPGRRPARPRRGPGRGRRVLAGPPGRIGGRLPPPR